MSDNLTRREREVLDLLRRGLTLSVILSGKVAVKRRIAKNLGGLQ